MAFTITKSVNFALASSQYLHRTDSFGLSELTSHTFEAWVKITTQPTGQQLGLWTLGWARAGLRMWYEDDGGTKGIMIMRHGWFVQQNNFVHPVTLTTNTWYHLAYTYNGNATKLYINGTEVASGNLGNTTGNSISVNSTLGSSAGNSFPGELSNSRISCARLWSTVRTQTEINDNKCTVFGTSQTGLVAEWSLDDVYTSVPSNTYPWAANNSPTFVSDVTTSCSTSVTTNAGVVSATFTLPARTVTAVQNVSTTAGMISASFSLPARTVTAIQNATASPSQITATFSLPSPNIITPDAQVSPNVITATFTLPARTVTGQQNVSSSVGCPTASFALLSPSISGGATISPSPISAVFTVNQPAITGVQNVSVAPNVLTAEFSLPSETVSAEQNVVVLPETLIATFSLPSATVEVIANITVNPAVLVAVFSMPNIERAGGVWSMVPKDTDEWSVVARPE